MSMLDQLLKVLGRAIKQADDGEILVVFWRLFK